MTRANMYEQGVHHLIAFCLNDACRHSALIDVAKYRAETEVPWFRTRIKCGKCGGRGNEIDVQQVIEIRVQNNRRVCRTPLPQTPFHGLPYRPVQKAPTIPESRGSYRFGTKTEPKELA